MYLYLMYEEGSPECRQIYFLRSAPTGGPTKQGGKVVPTVAARTGFFLMPRNDPRCQEKPGEGDSHDCYTREAA